MKRSVFQLLLSHLLLFFPRKSNIIKKHKKTKSFCIFAFVISPNEARNLSIAAAEKKGRKKVFCRSY